MPISYQFLPWVRRGLAVALDVPDNLGVGAPLAARGSAHVGVTLAAPHDGTAIAPLPMRLHGPGDVIGIDQRLVVRTDPKPHATNFEPNYLPIVDFDPPDFPWMLTPAKAQDDRRLRPWLVLVVLEVKKTGLPRLVPGGLLPSIRIKGADVASELPDLADSWSWAHAQLVNENAAQIQSDLQSKPNSNISRLVCPRRLKELTDYVACVVPAFEPGRRRGLGLVPAEDDVAMTTLAPAWNKNVATDVVLPVYYHWEFSTSPKGDFESLCRRLRTPGSYKGTPVEQQLAAVGTIPMSVDNLLNGSTPGLVTTMEGALVPIKYKPGKPPPAVQAESLEIIVNTPQDQVANPVGNGATNAEGRRIEVKPPMYGGWHAQQHQVFRSGVGPASAPKLGKHWLADLNLNPRYRGAAGYGAEVVRKYQEDYVDACWEQIGEILDAEMKFNLTRLAIEALGALKKKHYDALPPERILQVFGPALPRIEALGTAAQTYRINGQVASLGGRLSRSSMPVALVDTAMRRVASPANRSLRMAARLNGAVAKLPATLTSYVTTMAKASKKPAAFSVNAFMPDGIIDTKIFDGVDLKGPATAFIDLSSIGLSGGRFTIGDVTQAISRAKVAQRELASKGVPELKIREGQHLGVFTDLHVERFGVLAANSPTVKSSDWLIVASQVESLGERGIEGFLIESNTSTALLQVHSMRLDSRSGQFTVDQVTGRFNAARRSLPLTEKGVARAAVAGTQVGKVSIGPAREFNTAGLFTALPPNALTTAAGVPVQTFTLNPSYEFEHVGTPGRVPTVVSITIPPAIRDQEVLNRFASATRGVQATWGDAFVAKRVEVQVIDFPLAQVATVLRARTDPALTLPVRLASTVSVAQLAVDNASAHVSAFLPKKATLGHVFMIPKLFDRVMAWPHLRNPFYRDLAEYDKNAFMPGVDDLPQDLIMLVQVNQYFIDAVMAGANFEMNRELLWRGFPTDLRGTPFQRFWGRKQYLFPLIEVLLNDMEPMHQWRKEPLGKRTDENMVDPNRIALLVRGQLLRRYPNTAVYAWKKRTTPAADPATDPTQLMKDANGNPLNADAIQTPVFSGFISPDITFFGFDIDKEDVAKWCFVLEEQMSEPRFGFDVPVTPPGQPQGTAPKQRGALKWALQELRDNPNGPLKTYNAYKALSWSHVEVAAGGFVSVASLVTLANPPFASFPTLAADATAADVATKLIQEPFRAYYLGADLAT
jgi:hypothetical protein